MIRRRQTQTVYQHLLCILVAFAAAAFVAGRYFPVHASAISQEEQLIQLEHKWNTLAQHKNADELSPMVADDYVYVGTEGQVGNKALLLKHMREGEPDEPRYRSYRVDQIHVRIFGQTAIIVGRWVGQGTDKNPSAMVQERWTDLWVKRGGSWKCEASQSTTIADQ